jgi:hypothetical protein
MLGIGRWQYREMAVRLHNMWVATELLCRCRLKTYKANEEIRKDATATTKKRLWNESRSKRVKRDIDISHESIWILFLAIAYWLSSGRT